MFSGSGQSSWRGSLFGGHRLRRSGHLRTTWATAGAQRIPAAAVDRDAALKSLGERLALPDRVAY
jgi:hypothetical protein